MTATSQRLRSGFDSVRSLVASVIWVVAVVCALILALAALFVALEMNTANGVVSFVLDGARKLDLGHLKDFTGAHAAVKTALVDWGVAAVVYLVVGRLLERLIRP